MSDTPKFIAVKCEGVVDVHAVGPGRNYATLCGLDGDDDSVGQEPAQLPARPKITCAICQAIIRHAAKYKGRDFRP